MIYLSHKDTNISQKREARMKKYSLIVRELLTDGIMGLVFIVCGIMGIFRPITLFSVVMVNISLAIEIIAIILRYKNKFEIWDEVARMHYSEARKITLNVLVIVLQIMLILGLCFKVNISINAFHIMILCGAIQIMLFIAFTVIEKRDA